jgi:hypothetical protein
LKKGHEKINDKNDKTIRTIKREKDRMDKSMIEERAMKKSTIRTIKR